MTTFTLNGEARTVDVDESMPLLWVLRDILALTGTKYGCGKGLCGACTVHLNGQAVRSCSIPIAVAKGQAVTTIEGVSSQSDTGGKVQHKWSELNVPQCGYCQPGQIMSATALLSSNPNPTDKDIDQAMSGNICRCGTYPRIRQAIKSLAKEL